MGAAVALGMGTTGSSSSIKTTGCHMSGQAGLLARWRGLGGQRPCPLSRHCLLFHQHPHWTPSVPSPFQVLGPPPLRHGPEAQASLTAHGPIGLTIFPLLSCPPTALSLAFCSPRAISSRWFSPELLLELWTPPTTGATPRPKLLPTLTTPPGHRHAPLIVTLYPSHKDHASISAMPHPLLCTTQVLLWPLPQDTTTPTPFSYAPRVKPLPPGHTPGQSHAST